LWGTWQIRLAFSSRQAFRDPAGTLQELRLSKLGILLVDQPMTPPINEAEYRRVFLAMSKEHADALVIGDQPEHFTATNRQAIANLAKEYRLPIIGPYRHYAAAGVLLSYGVDDVDLFRISATQVDRIAADAQGRFWHTFPVRGSAQVRQLSGVHLTCVRRRQTGRS
jgi:ABC-type uncharacterized transport system substrate-binding protein